MTWRTVSLVVLAVGAAFGPGLLSAGDGGDKAPADPQAIRRLVDQLGSDEFSTRDKATEQLLKLGEAALPALQEALRSTDPEVRRRVEKVIDEIKAKAEERAVMMPSAIGPMPRSFHGTGAVWRIVPTRG